MRTKVQTWREHDPEPGADEREAARFRRIEAELFSLARVAVAEISELRSDPELTAPVATVLAFADRCRMSAVEDAVAQARCWR